MNSFTKLQKRQEAEGSKRQGGAVPLRMRFEQGAGSTLSRRIQNQEEMTISTIIFLLYYTINIVWYIQGSLEYQGEFKIEKKL